MAISYPRSLPTHTGIRSIELTAMSASRITESPVSFAQQVVAHTGQRWEAVVTLPPMTRADAEQWIAWAMSMRGHVGTFTMGDPSAATPRGSAGGSPVVNGASQTGGSIVLDGAATSQTGWLKAGDYIQIGTTLHKVLTDADTDGRGNVTLDIWPDLRTSPADNASVTVSSATGLWSLATPAVRWNVNEMTVYGFSFAAVEAIRIG